MRVILAFLLCSSMAAAQPRVAPGPQPNSSHLELSFVSPDIRFNKTAGSAGISAAATWAATGWRGEKIHTQLLISPGSDLKAATLQATGLRGPQGSLIAPAAIRASFIGFVMTDGLNKDAGGCGIPADLDSSLVADVISNGKSMPLKSGVLQPVWLSIRIPSSAAAGLYRGRLMLKTQGKVVAAVNYSVTVLARRLPPAHDWKFALDLWQNPYSVARIYGVKSWSAAHFRLLRPAMKMLADAGQKAITTTIINDPWKGQTYDHYGSMISWVKHKNGSWTYDYSIFDQWVAFMISCGIDKEISCYSLIPWDLKYTYYDENTGRDTSITAAPGTAAYEQHWKPMLVDFAKHLRKKGWFDRTMIAMDERPLEAMQQTIRVIRKADRKFKISLAGNYHSEIDGAISDYSVASNQVLSPEQLAARRKKGYKTTYYTCCTEGMPNTFTFSAPAESTWLAWHAMNKGYDGYLRWAYNCWNRNPLCDSRYGTWSAGDAFLVYPGNSSSIRFERLIQGIQDAEKLRILQAEFLRKGEKDKAAALQAVLKDFELSELKSRSAADMVNHAESMLNKLAMDNAAAGLNKVNGYTASMGFASNHVYYVSADGNDAFAGTSGRPFQSINHALGVAKAGDTVLLAAGKYREKLKFPHSGSLNRYITLKPVPGAKVVIDGTDMPVTGEESLVLISGVSWIAVEGLEISNFKALVPYSVVNGIRVDDGATDVRLSGNYIHDIENTTAINIERSAHAILVIGNTERAVRRILIANNKVAHCKTGYSENITINGYVDGFTVQGNSVSKGENIGIVAAGGYRANKIPALNAARNGLISNNEVFAIDDSHGAPGIYLDGARNITVEGNKVHDVFRGIGVLSENTGFPTANCIIRNNDVYENDCAGIYLGGYEGQGGGGGTNHCQIIDNRITNNNRRLGYSKEVEGEIRMKLGCNDNVIARNTIYARPDRGLFVNKVNAGGQGNVFEQNTYRSEGINNWVWDGQLYTNLAAWQIACHGDQGATNN